MSGSGGARDAGAAMIAILMQHATCWQRVFAASWPVVTTGSCAWMREMHAQKKRFWRRCSQRKREAGFGIEPVWNRRDSDGSAVKSVSLNLSDLLAALGLFFVFEGIAPFINPQGVKRAFAKLLEVRDRELRIAGLGSMLVGVVILFLVR